MNKRTYQTDVEFIQALAEVLRENDLTELRVKRDYGEGECLNVHVSRGGAQPAPAPQYPMMMPSGPAPMPTAAAGQGEAPSTGDPSAHPGAVASPMVGTAYLSAEPGVPAFVAVGDTVTAGQTLLIVEAMKTMNQIPAPHAGKVTRILVEDGAPVEFGAPLMIVE